MSAVGLLHALERWALRPGLLVVTYHRIGSLASNPYYDPVFSATPEAFRAELDVLRKRFRFLRLDEVLPCVEAGLSLRDPAALLTFDDGYRDNVDVALPILQELGLPAVFFLVSGFLEKPRLPWWDRIAYVIKHTRVRALSLSSPIAVAIDLDRMPRPQAIWLLVEAFMNAEGRDEAGFFAELEARAEVDVPSDQLGRDLFMTWDDARRLKYAGMAIGSHSYNHANLALLAEDEQRRELRESKRLLEGMLGGEVTALAYPFGGSGATSETTQRLAEESGYRIAFTGQKGINRPGRIRPLALSRISVGYADTPALLRSRSVLFSAFGTSLL
jgi:peptidoglycan/xylan/chitin deacetylase (PgdA/CDA1 family)